MTSQDTVKKTPKTGKEETGNQDYNNVLDLNYA